VRAALGQIPPHELNDRLQLVKTKTSQFELPTLEEVFNLAMENGADGKRIQQELDAARKHAEDCKKSEMEQQPSLLPAAP
jgi:hypothetical protein